ncbi:Polyribonucleotide nucleotidyltransferase [Candidatus Bealeia paramacronuclearis]|uniref:Polyribonucleotide nucleotidyltransferase n=1 Tax=Candidatus Bealeia paramacronuclearis TaxID=1921001 RepID=A0ABZ2C281_9PROT|nr:Polyribonucleotide nucleotidyltransferase [Candidatus Bealeia paramacronuclearis]
MFNVYREELEWAGQKLVLETGKIARQADGAVVVSYGDTVVLCTVVAAKKAAPDASFFPLTVHYQEKTYAVGKIPGGFFKRETKPSDRETLISRLIDRPIRPLFPNNFLNDTQIICTVLSHDMENTPDIAAIVGASAALTISGVPFLGPIAGARVGLINGEYVLNPTLDQQQESLLNLVVAGTREGVLMVESEAKELSEAQMLGAVNFGHQSFQPVIDAIIRLAEKCAKDPWDLPVSNPELPKLVARMTELCQEELVAAYKIQEKQARHEKLTLVKSQTIEALIEEGFDGSLAYSCFKDLEKDLVRGDILKTGMRIDGRDTKTIRPIVCEVGILPRTHGSALFTRGETQAIVVTTLGTASDEQLIDSIEGEYREHFMLHYNFPPYSVGETGRMGAPGRREVGHGKLAWRALNPLIPSKEEFPYTIRVVSEITESNGSSSMASVCGGSLAMMDAGVPLARPVAGIAMGLIKEGKDFAVLSDILGDEDHLGDMDFKVAGTEDGVTALQMDIKITSITKEIMEIALDQAKAGRLHILTKMASALTQSRGEVSEHAPRVVSFTINKDKIREVIGSGGKVIREITETTGAKVDINDDGVIKVSSTDHAAIEKAVEWIKGIAMEPEIGVIYKGKIVKLMDFGAFVNFMGGKDGLVHISELAPHRVAQTSDVVKVDDEVYVKVLGFDRGKVRLGMKGVDQTTGEPIISPATEVSN